MSAPPRSLVAQQGNDGAELEYLQERKNFLEEVLIVVPEASHRS